jgi:hypothetical protein
MENQADLPVRKEVEAAAESPSLSSEAAAKLSSRPADAKAATPESSAVLDSAKKYLPDLDLSFLTTPLSSIIDSVSDGGSKPVDSEPVRGVLKADVSEGTDNLENLLIDSISKLSPQEQEQFKADMQAFVDRAQLQGLYGNDPSKVDDTLTACHNLLSPAVANPRLDQIFGAAKGGELRIMLAKQIMHEAAYPSETAQGVFGTCQATTTETLSWFRQPGLAAGIISDQAVYGEWTAPDGNKVALPAKDFNTDQYSKDTVAADGMRNYAGQLFQATVLSNLGTRWNPPQYYVADGTVVTNGKVTGVEYWGDSQGNKIKDFNGITVDLQSELLDKMNLSDAVILASTSSREQNNNIVHIFKDEAELKKLLEEAQKNDNMPVIIKVASGDQFFGGKATVGTNDHETNHVICIDRYDPATQTIVVDNQWQAKFDFGTKSVQGSAKNNNTDVAVTNFYPATQA